VDDLNFVIQNQIVSTLHSFKSTECVTNEDEAINYSTEFLNSLDVPDLPPQNLQDGLSSHHFSKSKPAKTMHWNTFDDKKTDDQYDHAMVLKGKFKGENISF